MSGSQSVPPSRSQPGPPGQSKSSLPFGDRPAGPKQSRGLGRIFLLWMERVVIGAVALTVLAYAADFITFTVRGKPLGQVVVNNYLSVPLKGNKFEYDFEGAQPTPCSQTLFPQGSLTPCWYLRRHTNHDDQP